MPQTELIIATSIAPGKNIPLQKKAVESFNALGAKVFSFNAPSEIATLEAEDLPVSFVPCPRTGESITGKPVVFLQDIFTFLADQSAETYGIFNSDIIVQPESRFMDSVRRHTPNALIAGRRRDTLSLETPDGENYAKGFDYFFFNDALIPLFSEDDSFCLGMPFWDYWMPFTALLHDIPLKLFSLPAATHPEHPTQWDKTVFTFMHRCIDTLLKANARLLESGSKEGLKLIPDFLTYYYGELLQELSQTAPDENRLATLAAFYDRFNEFMVHKIYADGISIESYEQ